MPNWCDNLLTISGDMNLIAKLVEKVRGENGDLDFSKVIPYPTEHEELDEHSPSLGTGHHGPGLEWCQANWGTNRNAETSGFDYVKDGVEFWFLTAWGPSTSVTAELARAFPGLRFVHRYEEGGNDLSGFDMFEGGKLVNSAEGEFDDFPITDHNIPEDDEGEN